MSISTKTPKRIVILGGGFGGMYAALRLEKLLRRRRDVEVVLVNRENYFLFTPMLHEVAASDLDLTHIVNPVRKLLRRVKFFDGDVERIDLAARTVTVVHGEDHHSHDLAFDHLVVGLGAVTNFYGMPGLEQGSLTMKTLGDAVRLRSRLIENLEEADFECCDHLRERLLTVLVAGGGFAGVETIASVNDFVRQAIRFYPSLAGRKLRIVLVHSGPVILPELGEKLGRYAQRKLAARGVEIRTGTRVKAVGHGSVELSDGTSVPAGVLVWTAGSSPHPLVGTLPCKLDRGRVPVDAFLQVPGWPGVWAVGDCAVVPDPTLGGSCPPTAQHASRQGRVVADNIVAAIDGSPRRRRFAFRTLGQLASIGRRAGVARIFGLNFSGFIAWWLWRTIYLMKLPRLEKKLRVMFDWTLDLFFSKDFVQFLGARGRRSLRHETREAPAPALEAVGVGGLRLPE